MAQNIFISYSRREVSFVDELARHLEGNDWHVWLDYRSIVPGKSWKEQIYQGLQDSHIVLLVVSKASIASKNVEMEWQPVLQEKDKRIILVIFEPVDLPPELEKYEWVDFRGNYEKALEELKRQLRQPEQEEHPVPETGFKVPLVVWASFFLAIFISVLSLGALWTLFIPFLLLPLPIQIMRRSFQYLPVQASLIMLPFALYLTSSFSVDFDVIDALELLTWISIPFVLAMVLLLRSKGMQRWGKPEAVSPVTASRVQMELPMPAPIKFFVDHAPQDGKIAEAIRNEFTSAGHQEVKQASSAAAVFTLISRFKNDSAVDCEKHVVYPVIVQSNANVSRQIARIQWLDFRTGVRNLGAAARLLPEPLKLLQAICIRPMGNQIVMPAPILYLTYYIAFLAIVCIGSWLPYFLQYFDELLIDSGFDTVYVQLTISLVLFGVISYLMGKHLVQRQGFFSSLLGLVVGMLLLGGILFWQVRVDELVFELLEITEDFRGISSLYPRATYIAGNLIMAVYLWFKRRDLLYWLPVWVK